MRNTLTRSASIALALALIAMLTPAGVTEAKGGKAVSWQVAIPTSLADRNLAGTSLETDSGYAIFQDQGLRGSVRVIFSADKVGGTPRSHFMLLIRQRTKDYGVEIDGVGLEHPPVYEDETQSCQIGTYSNLDAPDCMELFLNGTHPQWVYDAPIYDFSLDVRTDRDAQSLGVDDKAGGRLFLDMWNAGDQAGAYHSVTCYSSKDESTVTIARTGDNEWTISNGYLGADTDLTCKEWYWEPNPEGKSGHEARTVSRTVMMAETIAPFVFETIWTRK